MRVAVLLAALLLLGRGTAWADPLQLEIGRVGEVMAEQVGPAQPPRPGNIAGIDAVQNPRFTRLGTDIQGTFCKQFGLEFRAANLPPGQTALVQVTLDHPLWKREDGVSGTREVNFNTVTSDRWSYTGYTLEEDWSLVPGPWTFTISQGPLVLATVTFNVSVAQAGQHIAPGACDAPSV